MVNAIPRETGLVWTACLLLGLNASAETLSTGFRERNSFGVGTDETVIQSDPVMQVNGSWFDKTGDGTWKLPLGAIHQNHPFEVGVRAGTLEFDLDSRTRTAPAVLDFVAAKAACWLDANANVVTTNAESDASTAYASAWLDRRETTTDLASRRYPWMRPGWVTKNFGIPPTLATYNERTAVYFGGRQSGKYMDLVVSNTTGTAATISSCRHIFAVAGLQSASGAIVSIRSGSSNPFHPGATDGSISAPFILSSTSSDALPQSYSRFYYNGKQVNGATQYPVAGRYQLIEYDMPYMRPEFNAVFTDRNIASRAGGDYLAELIVFKVQLSEAERQAVERYLMAKWGCYQGTPSVAPAVAKDATVVLEGDDADSVDVLLRGEGRAVKRGAGTVRILADDVSTRFDGELDVEAGAARLIGNDVPLALAAGRELAVEAGIAGEDVTVAEADAGVAVKSGTGDAVATSVPADAKRLRVTGGSLTLRGRCDTGSVVPGSTTNVVLPDPSFEYYRNASRNQLTGANGWYSTGKYSGSTMDCQAMVWSYLLGSEDWPCGAPSPDGYSSLGIKADIGAYAKDLTVSETGVYELSFWTNARYTEGEWKDFIDVLIGPDADHLEKLATTVNGSTAFYCRQTYVTPVLTAGTTYQLRFMAQFLNGDGLTMIDDVKLRFVSRGGRTNEWKIPNGGFEDIDPTNKTGTAATYRNKTFTTNAHVFGWTFVQSPISMKSAVTYKRDQCSVGVFIQGASSTLDSGSGAFYGYSPAFQREGCARLGLFTTGGCARTTFTPPAGVWRLKAEMQRVRFTYLASPASTPPLVNAMLASPAGDTDLGTAGTTSANMGMEDVIWPNTFASDGSTAFTLTLSNTYAQSSAFLDNLVLLSAGDASCEHLANGGFESDGTWTYVADPKHTSVTKTCRMAYSNMPEYMGRSKYAGSYYAYVVAAGSVFQSVALPKAGAYRLSFNLSSRNSSDGGRGNGMNPIRAWVAQGSVTNEIGYTLANGTNFLQRAYVFTVSAAGTYEIGFSGTLEGKDRATRIDGVSLRGADAWQAATAAAPSMPEDLRVEVAEGATLNLAYAGTNVVAGVRLGGKRVTGLVSAKTHPAYIRGTGALSVTPFGLFIVVR